MGKKRTYTQSAYRIKEPERFDEYYQLIESIKNKMENKGGEYKIKDNIATHGYNYKTMVYYPPVVDTFLLKRVTLDLTKRGKIRERRFSWMVDGDITKLLLSEQEEHFLIACAMLRERKVLR